MNSVEDDLYKQFSYDPSIQPTFRKNKKTKTKITAIKQKRIRLVFLVWSYYQK